jgi:4-amino-4-deoxy-L-arabinose transferase-like glycosyltransferase
MPALRTALISTLLAGLTFLSAGGYGIRFTRYLAFEPWTSLEEMIFSSAAGFGILALVMMAAGAISGWTPAGAWIILAGGLTLSSPFIDTLASLKPQAEVHDQMSTLVMALCALWAFLLALAPVTYYDSLVYHFTIPAAYAQAHHWLSLKELIYPAFPQNLEMLWTLGLLLGGDTTANLISFTLSILTIAATGAFALRWLTRRESRLSMFLLAVMPAMLLLSSGGYVDVGLALYVFLSFYALCLWWETGRSSMLILAGLFNGLAMGVKYTGGIPFAAGGVLVFCRDHRRPFMAVKNLFFYGIAGILIWSPWLIKNTIYVGTPFFPFLYRWGNPKLSPWVQEAAAGYFRGVAEYAPCSLTGFIRLPWDIAMKSLRFGGGMDILGDYGWAPFVFLVPCLTFCRKSLPPIGRLMIAFAALFFVPWAFSRPVLRFLLPLAPVLSLLSAAAWSRIILQKSRNVQWVAKGLLTALILGGFGFFFLVEGVIQPFPVALGIESRDHYLTRKLNYYAAAQFVNGLPDQSLVFVMGDQRGYYYYNKRVIVSPVFNQNPLVAWANAAASSQDLAARIKARHITHILINRSEWTRLENSYDLFPFSSAGRRNWETFLSGQTRRLYHDAHCEVLALS